MLPHGAQVRFVVQESSQSTLGPEGLYSGVAPSLGFLSVSPSAHLLCSCASQGRSVPSPPYLLFLPWLWTPGGQGGLLLGGGWPSWPGAREGKEHEDACGLPGPLPYIASQNLLG